jgi:photosystem II stability/assembly factor-like uncharacterized protein
MAVLLHADSSQPVFATYLGGGGSEVVGSVATDVQGNIYIAGRTDSVDFPVKNAIQSSSKAFSQIFIAKFSPTGELLFSTYYGGTANDLATAIAVDPTGNMYVTGALQSTDFPVTNAMQPRSAGAVDAFVMKIDPSFHVVYSTYLGGKYNDVGLAIATDAWGNAYVTGRTESSDFPATPGAFQTTAPGRFNGASNTYPNTFVTKLDPSGNMVYSTFLSGDGGSIGWSIAVDALGQAHIAGETGSQNFPIAGNALQSTPGYTGRSGIVNTDAFLSKLSADGSSLVYSTLLGGPLTDTARGVSLDVNGNAYITGITSDARLPIVGGTSLYLGGDVYFVSNDGGATFQPQRSGLAAAEIGAIAFDPNTPSLIYAGTLQGMFRSSDNGSKWTPAGLDNYWIRSIAVDPVSPGTLYAGTYYGGGVFRSTDGGDTWVSYNAGLPNAAQVTFDAIAVDPSGNGVVYAVAGTSATSTGDQPLYRVTNGGATWTVIGHGLPSTPQALAVDLADGMLLAGTAAFYPFTGGGFGPPLPGIPGNVYRFDAGVWKPGTVNDDIHALAVSNGTLFAAGQKFYRSSDGGLNWTSTNLPVNGTATEIAVDPNNPSTIYALGGYPSPLSLLRSDDGGDSFRVVKGPTLTSIAVNPFDSSLHGGTAASADAYIAEFAPDGTLLYSNFVGTPGGDRGEGIAIDPSGAPFIVGVSGSGPVGTLYSGNFATPYQATGFVSNADRSFQATMGPTTSFTVLDMPSHGIAIAPDGGIIAVMIATSSGLPTPNGVQTYLNGASDVYLVKFRR